MSAPIDPKLIDKGVFAYIGADVLRHLLASTEPVLRNLQDDLRRTLAEAPLDAQIRAIARDQLKLSDGKLELDDSAIVSKGDDNGAYVATYSWVSFKGTPLDKNNLAEDFPGSEAGEASTDRPRAA